MDFILKFEYPPVEERIIFPANELVNNWIFRDDTIDEAHLCHYIGVIAQKMDCILMIFMHCFPPFCACYIVKLIGQFDKINEMNVPTSN